MMQFLYLAAAVIPITFAAPVEERAGPVVALQYATIVGSSILGIDSFKGIPFAKPPVGQLRLKPPQPITSDLGIIQAIGPPKSCPQFFLGTDTSFLPSDALAVLANTPLAQAATNSGEDCLTLNVQRPSTVTSSSKLPVVFWIFGGAFELGSTQTYDASELIATSIAQGKPIIYVSVNYRVGGFGWLPGKEILADGSSNLGLLDQRLGLKWVADNIAKFGGDPSKVTIWGESAGSISVFDQMALYDGDNTYNGKSLFRAAIMDSGSIIPADPIDCPKGQAVYDKVVESAGCKGSVDTLACLREISYETFLNAANSVPAIFSYNSVALSYLPRPDGIVLTKSPDLLVKNRQYAAVPMIIGDQEDEGTLFSLTQSNLTTTKEVVDYLVSIFFHDATRTQIEQLVSLYPDDPSAGSPFRTGLLYNIYPQFKRLAALLGDLTFTITRRVFLAVAFQVNPSVPAWSYLASYNYGLPVLGTFHGSDILQVYGITPGVPSATIQAYYISFFNTMDPNIGTSALLPQWPLWSMGNQLLNFNTLNTVTIVDNFRSQVFDYISSQISAFHI
jgi:acetylcholinesterase